MHPGAFHAHRKLVTFSVAPFVRTRYGAVAPVRVDAHPEPRWKWLVLCNVAVA